VADEAFSHHRSATGIEDDQRRGSIFTDMSRRKSSLAAFTENVTGESVIDIPLLKND